MTIKRLITIMATLTFLFSIALAVRLYFLNKEDGHQSYEKKNGKKVVLERVIYAPSDRPLKNPIDLAVTREGKIFVTDSDNNRIQAFSKDGEYLLSFGSAGSKKGQFQYPVGIATDSNNNLYVADLYNRRIAVLREDGHYLYDFPVVDANEQAGIPTAIAIDSKDRIYIIDKADHSVKVMTKEGKLLLSFGKLGNGSGQFSYPLGLAIDGKGKIHVADTGNNRLAVFSDKGKFLKNIPLKNAPPSGIAIGETGRIFASEPTNAKVITIDQESISEGLLDNNSPESLYFPEGVEYRNKRLYITDKGNNRVVVYQLFNY